MQEQSRCIPVMTHSDPRGASLTTICMHIHLRSHPRVKILLKFSNRHVILHLYTNQGKLMYRKFNPPTHFYTLLFHVVGWWVEFSVHLFYLNCMKKQSDAHDSTVTCRRCTSPYMKFEQKLVDRQTRMHHYGKIGFYIRV